MELTLSNHSSYPRIGDGAEHQVLRRTIARFEKGEATEAELRAAEDRATEMALEDQAAAGLDLVTDGQIRWHDPISHLAAKLEGVRINGLRRFFDTNFYFRQPVVGKNVRRTGPMLVNEWRFAKWHSKKRVKAVLTGPYTLAKLSTAESTGGLSLDLRVTQYAVALANEVEALVAAGVPQIQIDEPAVLRFPGEYELFERGIRALAVRRGSGWLGLAVYFGDPAPLYERFQKLPVDVLTLDFTYNPKLVERVASMNTAKDLGLGLVDGRNTRLEDPSAVARQLEPIAKRLRGGRAYLTTSCGLEYLPRDRALTKLKHLAAIKRTFLGSKT